jgi:hypothetical protein
MSKNEMIIIEGIPLNHLNFDTTFNSDTFAKFSKGKQAIIVLKFYFDKYQLEEASIDEILEQIKQDPYKNDMVNLSFFENLKKQQESLLEHEIGFKSELHGIHNFVILGKFSGVKYLEEQKFNSFSKYFYSDFENTLKKIFSNDIYDALKKDGLVGVFGFPI